jgi:hypothetical protein
VSRSNRYGVLIRAPTPVEKHGVKAIASIAVRR